MGKNYVAIHYIQDRMKSFSPKFVDCVVRCFSYAEQIKADRDCLSNTIALFICAKEYGYNPQICYGLCVLDNREFYHAWLKINDIVIDIAIYGNVNYNPLSPWSFTLETPYIGTYEDAPVHYGEFVFDEDWPMCEISKMQHCPIEKYMDNAPQDGMWRVVCKYLDITFSKQKIKELTKYIENIYI